MKIIGVVISLIAALLLNSCSSGEGAASVNNTQINPSTIAPSGLTDNGNNTETSNPDFEAPDDELLNKLNSILKDLEMDNTYLNLLWRDLDSDIYNPALVSECAKVFKEIGDTVNYKTIGDSYRSEFLKCFSHSGEGEYLVDEWIKEVINNKIVSEAIFLTTTRHVYADTENNIKVRGVFGINYSGETSIDYLRQEQLEPNNWYFRTCDVVMTLNSNKGSSRNAWVFVKTEYLSDYIKFMRR